MDSVRENFTTLAYILKQESRPSDLYCFSLGIDTRYSMFSNFLREK